MGDPECPRREPPCRVMGLLESNQSRKRARAGNSAPDIIDLASSSDSDRKQARRKARSGHHRSYLKQRQRPKCCVSCTSVAPAGKRNIRMEFSAAMLLRRRSHHQKRSNPAVGYLHIPETHFEIQMPSA